MRAAKECAGMCLIEPTKCNSFLFSKDPNICSLAFIGGNFSVVEVDSPNIAYIDTGQVSSITMLNPKINLPHDEITTIL